MARFVKKRDSTLGNLHSVALSADVGGEQKAVERFEVYSFHVEPSLTLVGAVSGDQLRSSSQ